MNKVFVNVVLSGSPFVRRIICPLLIPVILLCFAAAFDPRSRLFGLGGFVLFFSLYLTLRNPRRFWWAARIFTACIGYATAQFLGIVCLNPPSLQEGWFACLEHWFHPIALFLFLGMPCISYTMTGRFPGLEQMRNHVRGIPPDGQSPGQGDTAS